MNLVRALGVGFISLAAIGGWRWFENARKKAQMPTK